jgi:pimeloyl-ACP methyl ester carboxylesterase
MMKTLLMSMVIWLVSNNAIAQENKSQSAIDPAKSSTPKPTAPKSNFVSVNGVRLHYLDWGGSGETILFIHGFPGRASNFREIAPRFTDKFRVLGLTRRGHGESEKIETGYETDSLAEDVRGFLDSMNIESVILIGFSAGGDELTRFATLYPKRTIKLVYLDAAYDRRDISTLENADPLFGQGGEYPLTKIEAAMIKSQDEFRPDYSKIVAPTLSYYAIAEEHWAIKPGMDDATKKKAQHFVESVVQPRQWKNIEQFRREMPKGKVVVLRNTRHAFYDDPKLKDQVVLEIRSFLSKSN